MRRLPGIPGLFLAATVAIVAVVATHGEESANSTSPSDPPRKLPILPPEPALDATPREAPGAILPVQAQPPVAPPRELQPQTPTPASALQQSLAGLPQSALGANTGVVSGAESQTRPTSDAGSLLDKSSDSLGVQLQRRTPVVHDPRARGTRIGQLLVGGSFWFPARLDLDTAVSKIDASIVDQVVVVKGPYSVLYGPGHTFIDIELLAAPRYDEPQWHSITSFNFQTQGQQWFGRESILGGGPDWGVRAGYDHRTGNDYRDATNIPMPSSYNSRSVDFALGLDQSPDSHVDFFLLRLDQTNLEFPGQIFDINALITDGYELNYVLDNQPYFDRFAFETWYNRTVFSGNAQRQGTREEIPQLNNPLAFIGFTNADMMSTGYTLAFTWGQLSLPQNNAVTPDSATAESPGTAVPGNAASSATRTARTDSQQGIGPLTGTRNAIGQRGGLLANQLSFARLPVTGPFLTMGSDLRFLDGELNEIDSFNRLVQDGNRVIFAGRIENQNFPVPRSHWVNPGLFLQGALPAGERLTFRAGSRVDWVTTNLDQIPAGYSAQTISEILGGKNFNLNYPMWAAFLTSEYEMNSNWSVQLGFGHSERAPNLTELYALGPFLGILQQGFTSVAGNVGLLRERAWQLDAGLRGDFDRFHCGLNGFYSWVHDYVTYEAVGNLVGIPNGLGVRYVNTDLATLAGYEAYGEYRLYDWLTPFATVQFVEGRDLTRDDRGIIPGSPQEPLPGIAPLEARLGLRWHDPAPVQRWSLELLARCVNGQGRVASSLLEQPTAGFTVWNLRGNWQATEALHVIAGVENFTNREYREHLDLRTGRGVYQPGVNFYVGSELRY
jgi:outer membrane receptor protein involved in Fe transport